MNTDVEPGRKTSPLFIRVNLCPSVADSLFLSQRDGHTHSRRISSGRASAQGLCPPRRWALAVDKLVDEQPRRRWREKFDYANFPHDIPLGSHVRVDTLHLVKFALRTTRCCVLSPMADSGPKDGTSVRDSTYYPNIAAPNLPQVRRRFWTASAPATAFKIEHTAVKHFVVRTMTIPQ